MVILLIEPYGSLTPWCNWRYLLSVPHVAQRLPSGPVTSLCGWNDGPSPRTLRSNWFVIVPSVKMRPSLPQPRSANQIAPSGPFVIPIGSALTGGSWGAEIVNSVIGPVPGLLNESFVERTGDSPALEKPPAQPAADNDVIHVASATNCNRRIIAVGRVPPDERSRSELLTVSISFLPLLLSDCFQRPAPIVRAPSRPSTMFWPGRLWHGTGACRPVASGNAG